jgi:hypothetical protein
LGQRQVDVGALAPERRLGEADDLELRPGQVQRRADVERLA